MAHNGIPHYNIMKKYTAIPNKKISQKTSIFYSILNYYTMILQENVLFTGVYGIVEDLLT